MNNKDINCDEVLEKENVSISINDDGFDKDKEDIIVEDMNSKINDTNNNNLLNKKRSNTSKQKKTKGNYHKYRNYLFLF